MDLEGSVLVSGENLKRWRLICDLIEGRKTQIEVAEKLSLSDRQVRRLKWKVEQNGIENLVHGLRGRRSNNCMSDAKKDLVLNLWNSKYREAKLNFTHFTQKLNEVENVIIGKETVRRLLRDKNVVDRPPKKGRKHRRWRERRAQFGELLQQDTSPHDWLSTGKKQHAVVIVDDATSKLLYCQLFEHDGSIPNMLAMQSVFLKYGLPMGLYTDRASWFFTTHKNRIVNGPPKITGLSDFRTQIGRALNELGVEFIPAFSPQAKGRVERANGTLQDRLIAELKLQKITDIDQANDYINAIFIADYNSRFGKEPADTTSAFVTGVSPEQLKEILCLKFTCRVAKDNTVTRAKYFKLQLEPSIDRINWSQAKVQVRIYPDLTVKVLHEPSQKLVPFKIIEIKKIREPKSPSELPDVQKISA
jgi:hypothetical protein